MNEYQKIIDEIIKKVNEAAIECEKEPSDSMKTWIAGTIAGYYNAITIVANIGIAEMSIVELR